MNSLPDLQTHRFGPLAAGRPKQLIVLFHGLGANGQDLISLAPLLAQSLPNALFVSPDAPYPCDMAPMGFQWFSLQEWTEEAMHRGIESVRPAVDIYLDKLLKHSGVSEANMVLGGFSQGAMLSMYVAPRRASPCAGVLTYSGALLGARGLKEPYIHKIPTCLIHGDSDTVVPVSAWHLALKSLKDNDFPVEGKVIPGLAHGIDEDGIATGLSFLKRVLNV